MLLWAPVPPVLATSLFERRFRNDPIVLQYAHRVMEEHPVELTFFFVPQVVQALRYDDLGRPLSLSGRYRLRLTYAHRLCLPVHIRNCQNISAFLSPNYLEYEGKLLQR